MHGKTGQADSEVLSAGMAPDHHGLPSIHSSGHRWETLLCQQAVIELLTHGTLTCPPPVPAHPPQANL